MVDELPRTFRIPWYGLAGSKLMYPGMAACKKRAESSGKTAAPEPVVADPLLPRFTTTPEK
jgi:hypothetical protein